MEPAEELESGEAEIVEQVLHLVQAIKHVSDDPVRKQYEAVRAATSLLIVFTESAYEAIGAAEIVKQGLMDFLQQQNKVREHE